MVEVLWNIRHLVKDGKLDQEDTYLHPGLVQILGGEEIHWRINVPGHRRGRIEGFDKLIPKLYLPNGNVFEGMGLKFNYNTTSNQAGPCTWFMLNFSVNSNVPFELIEEIFGTDWELDEAAIYSRVIQHGRIFDSPTHEMGNTPILYHLDSDPFGRVICIETNSDATLSVFRYEAESTERKQWLRATVLEARMST